MTPRQKSMSLVAWPKQIGNTPLAKGSMVPPWPTLRWPVSRLSLRRASMEVIPGGLKRFMNPFTGGGPVLLRLAMP